MVKKKWCENSTAEPGGGSYARRFLGIYFCDFPLQMSIFEQLFGPCRFFLRFFSRILRTKFCSKPDVALHEWMLLKVPWYNDDACHCSQGPNLCTYQPLLACQEFLIFILMLASGPSGDTKLLGGHPTCRRRAGTSETSTTCTIPRTIPRQKSEISALWPSAAKQATAGSWGIT